MSQYSAPVNEAPVFIRRTEEFHTTTWGSILIGAASAIALQLLFTVLGLAIGVSVQDPDRARPDASGLGTAAGLWWLITGTIALAVGAMIMSCVSRPRRDSGLLVRGFAMWSIVAIFGFIVIWSGLGMASMTAASPLGSIASADRYSAMSGPLGGQPNNALNQSGSTDAAGDARGSTANDTITSADRREAASAARTASWWTLVGLVLGITASLLGAWYGAPREDRPARVRPVSTPATA